MTTEKFIVKVQASLTSNNDVQSILIYNEDESVMAEFDATDDVLKLLDGRPKAFFFAHIADDGGLILGTPAPWQQW